MDLNPGYQRDIVWPKSYKVYLMDTIIKNLSVPKVYIESKTDEKGSPKYIVADGKQRLTAIFEFINNEFPLDKKYAPELDDKLDGLTFSELPHDVKSGFFDYKITVDDLKGYSDRDMKDMFVRLNKNNARLTKQELRHAAYFEGDFLKLSEDLTEDTYWQDQKIVSNSDMRRMRDTEFVSELLMLIEKGITDKQKELTDFYASNEEMPAKLEVKKSFIKTLELIKDIMPDLKTTRFNNKGDFYSIFFVINYLIKQGFKFNDESNQAIRKILIEISKNADIKSENPDLREYQNLTTQSSDSMKSRKFRADYLRSLIEPLLIRTDEKRLFTDWEKKFIWHRTESKKCCICGQKVDSYDDYEPHHNTPWGKGGPTILANGEITHKSCNRSKQDK